MSVSARRHILDLIPEYRAAERIGAARLVMKEAEGGEEVRLTAFLFHQGVTKGELASLFAVTPKTIEKRLTKWRTLARASNSTLPPAP